MSRNSTSQTTLNPSNHHPIKTPQNPPTPPPMTGARNRGAGACTFRLPTRSSKFQPVKFLRRLGAKLARAMRLMSMRKQRSSCKVSSSSSAALVRSRSCADPITDNSHRAEAIGDCIEFLNSSSLPRSNSVSSSCS